MNYYYADPNGQVSGPVSEEQLRQLHASGVVQGTTFVLEEGGTAWEPYSAAIAKVSLPKSLPPIPPIPPGLPQGNVSEQVKSIGAPAVSVKPEETKKARDTLRLHPFRIVAFLILLGVLIAVVVMARRYIERVSETMDPTGTTPTGKLQTLLEKPTQTQRNSSQQSNESRTLLPSHYGLFAVVGIGLVDVKAEAEVSGAATELVLYEKIVSRMQSSDVVLEYSQYYVRFDISIDEDGIHARSRNNWSGAQHIPVTVAPVKGNAEMIRITPTNKLSPGRYTLAGTEFFIERTAAMKNQSDAWPLSSIPNMDDFVKQITELRKNSLSLLKLGSSESFLYPAKIYDELQERIFKDAIASAQAAMNEQEWDKVIAKTKKALQLRPDDKTARDLRERAENVFSKITTFEVFADGCGF